MSECVCVLLLCDGRYTKDADNTGEKKAATLLNSGEELALRRRFYHFFTSTKNR